MLYKEYISTKIKLIKVKFGGLGRFNHFCGYI